MLQLQVFIVLYRIYTIMNKLGFSNPTVQRRDGALNFNKYHNRPKQKNKSNNQKAKQKRQKRENEYN